MMSVYNVTAGGQIKTGLELRSWLGWIKGLTSNEYDDYLWVGRPV